MWKNEEGPGGQSRQCKDGGTAPVQSSGALSPPAPVIAPSAGPLDAAHAKVLIAQANARHDIQTSFFTTPKPDEKSLEGWRKFFEWLGHLFRGAGELFAPLAPIIPYLIGALVIVVIALLLSPVVRLFLTTRFERLFQRHNLKADAPWRPTRAAVAALLEEIDALAAKGEYDEAVHLLLVRSVADINAFRPDLVRLHYSARDIMSHPLLPVGARPAFTRIVSLVERSFFAGIPVGKDGFDACRQAYVDFVAAEGIA